MEKRAIEVDIKVPNQTRYLSLIGRIGEDIAKELDKFGGDRETLAYHMNLVLTEALVNAIKYANAEDPDKMVHIMITIADSELTIRVYDDGQGFDINSIPPPRLRKTGRSGARRLHHQVDHGFCPVQEDRRRECPGDVKTAALIHSGPLLSAVIPAGPSTRPSPPRRAPWEG